MIVRMAEESQKRLCTGTRRGQKKPKHRTKNLPVKDPQPIGYALVVTKKESHVWPLEAYNEVVVTLKRFRRRCVV